MLLYLEQLKADFEKPDKEARNVFLMYEVQ
jgi:hypothetical protein